MTYRNDHDAALARVDALERENAALAAENAKLRRAPVAQRPEPERRTDSELDHPFVQKSLAGSSILLLVTLFAIIGALARGCAG